MTYLPSMVNLTHSVNIVAKEIISIITAVPRIRGQNFDSDVPAGGGAAVPEVNQKADDDKFKSYYEIISDDNDILRIVVQVNLMDLLGLWAPDLLVCAYFVIYLSFR